MSFSYRISEPALADLDEILEWSAIQFGEDIRNRYAALIKVAVADITANPYRIEARKRPDLREGLRSWHLRMSRERARRMGIVVHHPRHFLLYRVIGNVVRITRILHEKRDLRRHSLGRF